MTPKAPPDRLTETERLMVSLLAEGLTMEEIAERLGRTVEAVRSRLNASYRRLGIGSRADQGDAPLSPAMRYYLHVFEQLTCAKDDEDRNIVLEIMEQAAKDAGLLLHAHHTARSRALIDMLVRYGRGELKPQPRWISQPGDEALTWRAAADEMREAA